MSRAERKTGRTKAELMPAKSTEMQKACKQQTELRERKYKNVSCSFASLRIIHECYQSCKLVARDLRKFLI